MSINAVWWIGWGVAAMVVGRGLAASESWRVAEQPELKQLLEEASVLPTESLGEPARGVNTWEHWAVPNPDDQDHAALWYRLPEDAARATKSPSPDTKPEDLGWRSIRLDVPMYPHRISALALLPDGRLFSGGEDYVGSFVFDPKTDQATLLGRNQGIAPYTHIVYGEKLYSSGYPAGPLYVFDPRLPWTVYKGGPPGLEPVLEDEGYVLDVTRSGVLLAGRDARGVFWGAQTLAQLMENRDGLSLPVMTIRDWPRYLTSKRLKQVFDSFGIQRTGSEAHFYSRYFPKDSQHPELAGGSWLTTEEIRRIKQECDQRHIEIIPEVQSLSHSYYLCCAHPDIAERENDPWPDTYCPSNPKTYELLFDVMDEVIAAFKPRIMHIGHDEAYTFAICPRCQGRSGADLLAGDINTIHEYLAGRGVRPLMWCDKLTPLSGVEDTRRDPGDDRTWYQPPTIDAIVWGISHDVLVEDCYLHDGARLAIHSGSGSQRSIVRCNHVERCREGIYFCWGAQHGLYERNVIEDCNYGMTLGHSDSDNLIRDNDIRRSGEAGIHFRGGNKAFAPHRSRFERNRIIDSGGEKGVAIDINGETESVMVVKNELRETRKPLSRIGIFIGAETRDIRCEDNQIDGFAIPIKDLRKG